jgi:hypothetical protein
VGKCYVTERNSVFSSSSGLGLHRHGLADFLRMLESQRSLYQSQDALIDSEGARLDGLNRPL